MFDDRLEITSPGGMLSGSRIQEMDLRRVPSMRRNEIISDIFGRLHYMDRRGSGIGRILNSYTEFTEKPQFYSTETYFLVVLPNRSVAEPAQTAIELPETQSAFEKTQLSSDKTQFTYGKTQLNAEDRDWELIYFRDVFLKERGEGMQKKAIDRLVALFDRYRYNYNFNRRNIADLFSITENAGSRFLKACLDRQIIHKIKTDEYCFVPEKE
jgi:ATP-dependent DNA helicase RecG